MAFDQAGTARTMKLTQVEATELSKGIGEGRDPVCYRLDVLDAELMHLGTDLVNLRARITDVREEIADITKAVDRRSRHTPAA